MCCIMLRVLHVLGGAKLVSKDEFVTALTLSEPPS